MFTLLSPFALLALLGLLVPVAIHLWNRRPGREVAVGSLRWLAAGANRRLRNLKPEQLWLLLLRATLLGVLAVAVAGPVWRQALPGGRGQVLLSPEVIGTPAFAALRPALDSLRRRGYALRWLTQDFPKMSRATLRADSLGQRDSARLLAGGNTPAAGFYAARVHQAAGTFAGQPLYVVTPAVLRSFPGMLNALPAGVTWQMLPANATNIWVQAAASRGDSLRLLVAQSSEAQTTFRVQAIAKPRPGGVVRVAGPPAYRLAGNELQPVSGSLEDGSPARPTIPIRTKPLRIVLFATPDYALDARYLQAGLRAASAGLLEQLSLSTTAVAPSVATPPDWLFWLSEAPLPATWQTAMQRGTKVWQEAAGPGVAAKTRLVPATADEAPATIIRHTQPQPDATAAGSYPLWLDGQGRAVLSRREVGQGAHYQFATRLNPTWSDLADSPALPARLLALLQPTATDAGSPTPFGTVDQDLAAQDQRALDPVQMQLSTQPSSLATPVVAKDMPLDFRQTDLRPWFVLLAGLLFALERVLAHRRESQPQPSLL